MVDLKRHAAYFDIPACCDRIGCVPERNSLMVWHLLAAVP
jgi:hypothetical protein